jgi:GTP-binding protein EngB required for normal cell division
MDARHPHTALDVQLLEFLQGHRLLVLLSKADKLPRAEHGAVLEKMQSAIDGDVLLFSSVTRQGVEQFRDLLEQWLRAPAPQVAGIKNPR